MLWYPQQKWRTKLKTAVTKWCGYSNEDLTFRMRKCKTYLYIYENCQKPPCPLQQQYKGCSWFFTLIKLYGCYKSRSGGIILFPYLSTSSHCHSTASSILGILFLINYMLYRLPSYSSFLLYNCEKVKDSLHSRLFLKNRPPVFISYNNYK